LPEHFVFSSDYLPRNLTNRARFNLWRDIHNAQISSLNYTISDDLPFHAQIDAMTIGQVVVGEMTGTLTMAERTRSNIIEDSGTGHNLFINRGQNQIGGIQAGREFLIEPGAAVLVSNSEPLQMFGENKTTWETVLLPHRTLGGSFHNADDRIALNINGGNPALDMLCRYTQFIAGSKLASPEMRLHASSTIIDLVALASGLRGHDADVLELQGLRAARYAALIDHIRNNFRDPMISAARTARVLGLSPRYLHSLLHETGVSFSEHVLELRLQQSRLMLTDRNHNRMLISEIALTSGFSDISYFNRSFRRRFGCTPGSARRS
jgi:AraC-like DNA-binding protein